jgi:CheY-like chemotaxis protein
VSARALRVCIIDDDPIALRVTSAAIRSLGHEVTIREQSLGSLSAVVRERPDVVVLDLAMPGLSGAGLGDLIRDASAKAGRRIALVICSGAPTEVAEAAARQLGAIAVVNKSTSSAALRSAFSVALAGVAPAADHGPGPCSAP